jgi:DNA-binding NarL/FixJ family response regulator
VESGAGLDDLAAFIRSDGEMVRVDVVTLDTGLARSAEDLGILLNTIQQMVEGVSIICLAQEPAYDALKTTQDNGARAYLVRESVGPSIAAAIHYTLSHQFTVSGDMVDLLEHGPDTWLFDAETLPQRRTYPRLTRRVEQALQLCVVEGLPAELAAEEMGVSTSTIRSYIKEGYRILEASDRTIYPDRISPVERAFLRYTALHLELQLEPQPVQHWQSAA